MGSQFPLTIDQLVKQFLPAGFSVSEEFQNNSITIWQSMLWEGLGVSSDYKYDMSKYPDGVEPLFASLVVYDVLNLALTQAFLDGMGTGSEGEEGSESGGGIKTIKTGPTEVEFHDNVSSLAKLISAARGSDGLITLISNQACYYARMFKIKLPFCPSIKVVGTMIKAGAKLCYPNKRFIRRG